ncbi:MAG: lysylphosphatidylglycerol synthase domain-containing protein [Candidatus Saccharimonadales bacterium]
MLQKTVKSLIEKSFKLYRKTPKQLLAAVLFVIIVVFLVLYLRGTDFEQLRDIRINWYWMGWSVLVALIFRYLMVVIWRVILRALGAPRLPSFRLMTDIYAKSWLARYIPGTVPWIAGKIVMAASYGISKSRLTVSSLLEAGMQVASAVVVSLVLIGFSPRISSIPLVLRVLLVAASAAGLVVLSPPIFNRLLTLAHKLFRKGDPHVELKINGSAVWRSFSWFVLATFINGAACFLLIHALVPSLPGNLFLYVVGAFALAGAIGMATPLLPSGIGVRDGALLVLLSAVFPRDIALAVTVISRVWQIAADLIFFAIAWSVRKLWPAEQPN